MDDETAKQLVKGIDALATSVKEVRDNQRTMYKVIMGSADEATGKRTPGLAEKFDEAITEVYGDPYRQKVGLVEKVNKLDSHFDGEIKAVNAKVDALDADKIEPLIDAKKKVGWVILGWTAAVGLVFTVLAIWVEFHK